MNFVAMYQFLPRHRRVNMVGVGGMFGAADRAPMPISTDDSKPITQSVQKPRRVNISSGSSTAAKKRKPKCNTKETKPQKRVRNNTKVTKQRKTKKKATKKKITKHRHPTDIFS